MKRYGLGEVGSAEVPEDRSQRLTLASFGRQQPKFPISLEAHALGGWQFDDLTADNVLIFPHKTLLMQVYRVRHASWRNQHSGLFGVVFRMPSIAAERSIVAHNHVHVNTDREGPRMIIVQQDIGTIVIEPLKMLLTDLDQEYQVPTGCSSSH